MHKHIDLYTPNVINFIKYYMKTYKVNNKIVYSSMLHTTTYATSTRIGCNTTSSIPSAKAFGNTSFIIYKLPNYL